MTNVTNLPGDLLVDNKVKDNAGEDIGRVEELVIHPRTGSVSHAVIAFGGFLGISDRLFAVPWSAIELDARTRTFRLRIDRRTLREAPKFTRSERAHLRREYLNDVDAHYAPVCTAA